jgi:hypothetical protein
MQVPHAKTLKGSVLTEQVLNCKKVKLWNKSIKAAIRARRVKTNFTSEPQATIWGNKKKKTMYGGIPCKCSDAFHLSHPFLWRRPKKFAIISIIFPSQGLCPAEGDCGLFMTGKEKRSLERLMQKSESSKASVKANYPS